jgi:2-polyprenyl-6-hydroxyphenyl methylase/3-demethylubiquinone-9 3-methyltransferase
MVETGPARAVKAGSARMTRFSATVASVRRLDRRAQYQSPRACKVCQRTAVEFDRVDFNKYCSIENYFEFGLSGIPITYFRCLSCGCIYTEDFDDWSRSDFAERIYNEDYIKVDGEYARIRPEQYAQSFALRFSGCENARILDYGAGAGIFVQRMRELGYRHIEAYDPFSSPTRPDGTFDIITCFEVIEHSTDPVATVGEMKALLRDDGCIVFSQTVQPPDILSRRGSWWYLAPRNGHASTFTEEALAEIGRRHAFQFYRSSSIYGFARPDPSSFAACALRCAGSSFATLRLLAPHERATHPIAFPSPDDVIWHAAEDDGIWRFRWTGAAAVVWEGRWDPVSTLQVRVPVLQEAEASFGAKCELELNGQRKPVWPDRGELVAEFDVSGLSSARIVLHTPDPSTIDRDPSVAPFGPHGLAILVDTSPYGGLEAPGLAA